jgi:IS5 family transposase
MIFIPSDPGHVKADGPQENESKARKNQRLKLNKKCGYLHVGYKPHSINNRNYELIMSFKTITT